LLSLVAGLILYYSKFREEQSKVMELIYGVNPVKVALSQQLLERLFLREGAAGLSIRGLKQAALAKNIPVEHKDRDFFAKALGAAKHQGVAGVIRSFRYTPLDSLLLSVSSLERATLLLLDQINDPQNLGALLRVAHCGGIDGVIVPERHACPITPAVIKASAGAAFFSKLAVAGNLTTLMMRLKEGGFWIYGAAVDAKMGIGEVDFADKSVLVLGAEGQGLRRLVAQNCDVLFSIPMRGAIGSLNVAVAAGIVVYERGKRMMEKG